MFDWDDLWELCKDILLGLAAGIVVFIVVGIFLFGIVFVGNWVISGVFSFVSLAGWVYRLIISISGLFGVFGMVVYIIDALY